MKLNRLNIKKFVVAVIAAALIMGVSGCDFSFIGVSKSEMEKVLNVDTIYDGISIEGMDVGGLTKEECMSVLKDEFGSNKDSILFTAAFNDKSWQITPEFLGTDFDYELAVNEAYGYARGDSLKENYKAYLELKENPLNINLNLKADDSIIEGVINKFAEEINTEAVDAKIERTETVINITEDVTGYTVNKEAVASDFKEMLQSGFNGIYIIDTAVKEPAVKKADIEENFSLLGSYNTSFSGGDWGRCENIRLASSNINGTVVEPGEVFSSYEAMGEQTAANGYQYAGVIENGVLTSGIGGGVCQVSTTLYNAVIRAELEVVERKNHSLKIGYVPAGMDAAIAGTYTDFKFKNSTDQPVYVEMYTESNKVYANIYGRETRPENRTVDFETVYISSIPKPAEKVTYDPELPDGERVITKNGSTGSVIDVYKLVYVDGELESREYFNRSKYSATADEVTIGQKKEAAVSGGAVDAMSGGVTDIEDTSSDEIGDIITGSDNQQFELVINENGEEVYVPIG